MKVLDIKGLKKSFTQKNNTTEVLKGIDITVEKGDVIAILGPSGSGKTTLLRCINFLNSADEGTMDFEGDIIDFSHVSHKKISEFRKRTAFVFQNFNLFLNKTALENVTIGLTVARGVDKETANKKGMELLERVGLKDRYNHYPSELSGGQQQRVAIARALAYDPEIIFFDEPTSALDPELIGEVLNVIKDLAASGMTMMVVTHEMNFAKNVSNKVIFMDKGYIIEDNNSKDFFENPREERSRIFIKIITEREG